jgi:PIN domain nuclease of toxin-antitoxin system
VIVLDTSAVLAFVFAEKGAEAVRDHLAAARLCSVNATEIITKMVDRKWPVEDALTAFELLGVDVVPFDRTLALRAGAMRETTEKQGLSLGDRACLAFAERERLPVLTGDRIWANLDIGVEIRLIR